VISLAVYDSHHDSVTVVASQGLVDPQNADSGWFNRVSAVSMHACLTQRFLYAARRNSKMTERNLPAFRLVV
tara:strand:- start:71 stop:286 length:216 start_codon:yes stop_codon:yes gene_type:complete